MNPLLWWHKAPFFSPLLQVLLSDKVSGLMDFLYSHSIYFRIHYSKTSILSYFIETTLFKLTNDVHPVNSNSAFTNPTKLNKFYLSCPLRTLLSWLLCLLSLPVFLLPWAVPLLLLVPSPIQMLDCFRLKRLDAVLLNLSLPFLLQFSPRWDCSHYFTFRLIYLKFIFPVQKVHLNSTLISNFLLFIPYVYLIDI